MIVAIVPAAGRSGRMGRPKLLLQHEGRSILARVVDALRRGGAELVLAVVPPETEPEGPTLAEEALRAGASVIAPAIRPDEMRDSIETGLHALAGKFAAPPGAVLIVPADSPGVTPELVSRLIEHHRGSAGSIIIPSFQGKRGHPILVPWETALRIPKLPESVGVNALVASETEARRVIEIALADDRAIADVDTPEDWTRWKSRLEAEEGSMAGSHRISVRLFALAKQLVGAPEVVVELAEGATIAELKQAIARAAPSLAPLLPNVLIAVDSDYAADDQVVPPNAQVAVIPPVSGGVDVRIIDGDRR